MAYCVAGNYTIQNKLLVGTESFTGVGGLGVCNGSFGGGPNGLLTLIGGSESSVMFQSTNVGADVYKIGLSDGAGNSSLQFRVGSAERMRITCGGNIGIGTSSPATQLEIKGTNTYNKLAACFFGLYSSGFAFSDYNSGITYDAGENIMCLYSNYTAYGGIALSTCGSPRMFVNVAGNVGIGCTTPTYKLHVNGTFYAAGSSQDYKQSICNYNTDSCMFMKLKPVTYQYKEEYCHLGKELKSGTQIGLIAEEVAEVYPELAILVNEDDQKIVRNVDYEKLSIVLLSEVQKLRKELDELKTK